MKTLIGMSGGVDSSVAAFLLRRKGYECHGATMRLTNAASCCDEDNIADAKAIAEQLGIGFEVFDFTGDFKTAVVDKFCKEYISGRTPNPCIECNRQIKWKLMFEKMAELGADYVVTGHYARISKAEDGKYVLLKGKDPSKDQSYVLYNMTQEQLSHTLFPIGEFSKDEIRKIAEENHLLSAHKKDSQDICFIPDGDYAAFIESYFGFTPKEGDYLDINGNVIGKHKGVINYTVGQRKGLGVAFGKPMFVVSKNAENNTVTLSCEQDLFSDTLYADDFNFISGEVPTEPLKVTAKTRYSQKDAPAVVYPEKDGLFKVVFDTPQRAITPGQAVVIYDGERVLGGGKII